MTTVIRAQVGFVNDTGLPRDVAMNTWHFASDGVDVVADSALIRTALQDFYQAIDAYFSPETTSPANVKFYDLLTAPPRVPIFEDTIPYTPSSSDGLPNECAACLSYRGALLSGENPRRRRGRIFLGPLTQGASQGGTGDSRVLSVFRGVVATAAETLGNDCQSNGTPWIVFSPTTAGPEPWDEPALTSASIQVVAGYIDNAFDTVRSRGLPPDARSTFSVTIP